MDQMNYQGASSRTHELYGEPSTVYHACTVVENVAAAFVSCMEAENEARLIESLDSPL